MSNAFAEISAGLADAIEHSKSNQTKIIEHSPTIAKTKTIKEKAKKNPAAQPPKQPFKPS